jgi:ABC-type uncharacterized transport system permease subunit
MISSAICNSLIDMLNFFTIILYLSGAATQAMMLRRKRLAALLFTCCGILAISFHSYLLYQWIDLNTGQNLNEFNLLSLAIWLAAIIVLLMTIKQPVAYLGLLIFPLAVISIFLAGHFQSSHILHTAANPKEFLHILLSVVTFSVLFIAAIQALTLACQQKILKQKYFEISRTLPPIETLEKILFKTISMGVLLLTCLIVTSIYFFHEALIDQFRQKAILTFMAWLVFTALLIGRYYFGWRGKKAVYCTLFGASLLSIIYFGSMLITRLLP